MILNEILRSGHCSDGTVRISEVLLYSVLYSTDTIYRTCHMDLAFLEKGRFCRGGLICKRSSTRLPIDYVIVGIVNR